jgi:hypothetical protein
LLVGYVLFETYPDAVRAHGGCRLANLFLYPEIDPTQIVGGFSDNLRSRCVAIYDIPPGDRDDAIEAAVRAVAQFDAFGVARSGASKTALAYPLNRDGVVSLLTGLPGLRKELLNTHIMIRAAELIRSDPALVAVNGIGAAIDNARLRAIFEQSNGKVRAAMVLYNADNGRSAERALVLFENAADAEYAISSPPISAGFRFPLTIAHYRTRGELARGANQQQQQQPAQAAPPPATFARSHAPIAQFGPSGVPAKPRETLRHLGTLALPPEKAGQVREAVDRLSVDDVYKRLMDQAEFDAWVFEISQK